MNEQNKFDGRAIRSRGLKLSGTGNTNLKIFFHRKLNYKHAKSISKILYHQRSTPILINYNEAITDLGLCTKIQVCYPFIVCNII